MQTCDATTTAQATQPVQAPFAAVLALLACGVTAPACAVMTTVTDTGSSYALSLQVGQATGTDTVQFNVTDNNVAISPTPVAGTPSIDFSVTPVRPVSTASTSRPVTLRVDSSLGLACQSGGCGTTVIPFSKISWTVSNNGGTGDIQNGQFTGSTSQQIATFDANATYCSLWFIVCFGWTYQSNVMNGTRLTFTYANDTLYPAGTYKGTVYFTASME